MYENKEDEWKEIRCTLCWRITSMIYYYQMNQGKIHECEY